VRPVEEILSRPGGLAERLYLLRENAGLRTGQLAERLGWIPSKVTKIQRGQQKPAIADIEAWAEACGHPEVISDLVSLRAEAGAVHWRWQERLRRGGQPVVQEDIDRQTRQATRIRNLQIAVLPGLIQTPAYARHTIIMFREILNISQDDVETTVAARMRRQEVLYETGRTFEFVITENVLRRRVGSSVAMLGQLDRLVQVSTLPNVTLGIIPDDAEGLTIFPYQGFQVLDGQVFLDLPSGEAQLEPKDMIVYERIMDAALAASVTGDEARRLISAATVALGG
jgi:transcriptional regulator with XRE-family HTH domain